MASVSQLNQFPCKTFSVVPPKHQSKASAAPSSIGVVPSRLAAEGPRLCARWESARARPDFRVRVADDDEWGPDREGPAVIAEGSAVAVAEKEEPAEPEEIARLKKALVDSFYGTERGLKASSETRAEIVELITQLEAKNPNPAPTEALSLLNGKWILA